MKLQALGFAMLKAMAASALAGMCAISQLAIAQEASSKDFPNRPITIVVPYPPGSAADNVARPLTPALQEFLGQPVIVDNRAGAQGVIGAGYVAHSKPDGYTLLIASNAMFAGKSFNKSLPYDPIASFQAVSGISSTSMIFMVRADSAIKSLADFVQSAKSRKDPITVGFGAASGQIVAAMFAQKAGVAISPITYRGTPQALSDLLGGQIEVAVVDIGNGVPHMNSARLRGIAHSAKSRSSSVPNVPTLAETLPGATFEVIIAVMAPAGTPAAVVERLDKAIRAALARPEVKTRYAASTSEVAPLSTVQLEQLLKTDLPQWHALIKSAGIEPQ